MFLGALMQMLALTSDEIANFKQNKQVSNINERGKKFIKTLKINILFLVIYYWSFSGSMFPCFVLFIDILSSSCWLIL